MNKVILMGRLTRDPEVRYTQTSNTLVASFSLAVNRRFVRQGEERQADFINVVASTAFAHNGGYFKSVAIPAKRDDFWRMFEEGFPIHQIVHRLLPVTFRQQVRGVLKKLLKRI